MSQRFSTCLLLLMLASGCSGRKPSNTNSNVEISPDDVQAIVASHSEYRRAFLDSITTADSDKQRRELATKFSSYWQSAINQVSAIAEQQPSTTAGKNAAGWVVSFCDPGCEAHLKAARVLLEYHRDAPDLGDLCQHLTGMDPLYERILRTLASSNTSRTCRAHASFELAGLLAYRAEFRQVMDATPELQAERIQNMGEQLVMHLQSVNPERDRDEAGTLYATVTQKYADVAYRGGTLGTAAAERLLPLEQTYPEIGTRAPEIAGTDLHGSPLSSEAFQGNVVVVTFWASWCGACIDRIPEENRLLEEFQDADFRLFGVNGDEVLHDAQEAAERHSIQFTSWWDNPNAENRIVTQWNVTAWPTTFVIDQSGIIRYKNLSGSNLRKVISELLTQGKSSQGSSRETTRAKFVSPAVESSCSNNFANVDHAKIR